MSTGSGLLPSFISGCRSSSGGRLKPVALSLSEILWVDQLRQGGKNQLRFTHMIAQILAGKFFQLFMLFNAKTRPFLMNDIGQDGKFTPLFDVVILPVVGQLVSGFLPGHALLKPLFTEIGRASCRERV